LIEKGWKMKVIILAGGQGSRLQEETTVKPKPMVDIGGQPILWHIMKTYANYGHTDFGIALGFKSEVIRSYFLNYYYQHSDLIINLKNGQIVPDGGKPEDWKVYLADTGENTQTGGRLKRMKNWVGNQAFMFTYGDGVADINLENLIKFHKSHGKLATITAVRPPSRFGGLSFKGDQVVQFSEKPQIGEGWINGGFFVLEPKALDYIDGDETPWEKEPLERLASKGQLMAYRHESFWQCMDTIRDVQLLERLWSTGNAPWKVWK
jgi:glucose-1-phosphate cytidylyltransferase